MTRALLLAALMIAVPALPEGCTKMLGKKGAAEPGPSTSAAAPVASAVPIATATAPPIWSPAEASEPPPAPAAAAPSATAPPSPELTKARGYAIAGDSKKVRALLEKKVKSGKASDEEAALLLSACSRLHDKGCVEAIAAKHPGIEPAL